MEETKNPPVKIRVHFIHPCHGKEEPESRGFIQCSEGCLLCSGKMSLNHVIGKPIVYTIRTEREKIKIKNKPIGGLPIRKKPWLEHSSGTQPVAVLA